MIGSVLLIDAPAFPALPRCVARVDKDHGDASAFRLVADESAKLGKPPVTQSCALVAAGRYPSANTLEVFKGNTASGAFSIQYDSLGDAVVGVLLIPRLFAGELAQSPLGSLRAPLLQPGASLLVVSAGAFNVGTGIDLAVTIDGQGDDAEINAKPILGLEFLGLRDVAGDREYPLAPDMAQIDFPLAEGHQCLLVLAHKDRNDHATFDCPDADCTAILDEPDYPIVVRLGCVAAENRSDILVDLEGVGDLGDCSDGSLCSQPEPLPKANIGHLVQVVLPKRAGIKAGLCKPRRRLIAPLQRRHQARRLGFRRKHLNGSDQFHSFKYGGCAMRKQGRRG